jgi:hypothetical protein
MSNESKTWTVIGFWYNDRPVVTGVVEGNHNVGNGDTDDFYAGDTDYQGEWATSVSARDAESALGQAVKEMLGQDDDCEDES